MAKSPEIAYAQGERGIGIAVSEQLTIEVEENLKKALLHYCKATKENLNSVVGRALREFMAKTPNDADELWFGLTATDYFSLSEENREALWNEMYGVELEKPQPAEREVQTSALTPRQRGRETLRRRIREICKKPAAHR
jgi:predicted transcriptional regulator